MAKYVKVGLFLWFIIGILAALDYFPFAMAYPKPGLGEWIYLIFMLPLEIAFVVYMAREIWKDS